MHRSRMAACIGTAGLAVGGLMAGPAPAQTHTYTYDELGRLIATEIQSGANGPAASPAPNSPPTANDDFYLIMMPVNHGYRGCGR